MSFSWTRVRAILVKELRDYRRNRFVIGTMAFLPVLFVALPTVQLLTVSASAASSKLDARIGISLLYPAVDSRVRPVDPVGLLGGRRA